jgi:tRNA dimethylallyltransferase
MLPAPGRAGVTLTLVEHCAVAVVGPTGAGKSTLALDLAEAFHGEILNCDSMQLYRGFDIGTAKTPPEERRGIPHHLIDVLRSSEVFSAGDYSRVARAVLNEISARGRLPVVVGGTGFYVRALFDGLPALPKRDEELRAKLALREQKCPGSVHRLLARLEPKAARRIHANDTQKLIRALEIRILTRGALPGMESAEPLNGYRVLKLGLHPDRAALNSRLDARVREMFAAGLLDEVRTLLHCGATGNEKPFESLGYKQALAHIRGETTLEQAIASSQLETRQYAKRQWTWFRRDAEILWLKGFGNDPATGREAMHALQSFYKNIG